MNVPLTWLSEYVKLPTSEKELTDKLTMIGHMLDKRKIVDGEVVIDLELRGNRADMFGLIGVARDISTVFDTPLTLPKVAKLPKTNPKSPLIKADKAVDGLVKRYIAITLDIVVKPSPEWLAKRLLAYGIEPLNNVVDVTNYVMVETSHPMHAFDADKLHGNSLLLRMAKSGEKFETIAQGTTVKLTTEDIAICDEKGVQCLTCIGGAHTKVTNSTTSILLETAVYDGGNCRRTARRHKISTEGGGRHEKHQDPEELPYTLARAISILEDIAEGKVTSDVSDYYPKPVKPTVIVFDPTTITRLVGITIPNKEIITILKNLQCLVSAKGSKLVVSVPTFRTDIQQEADIVEEVVRIYGYERIPVETLSGQLPTVGTPSHVIFEDHVRDGLITMQLNEVITSTLIANTQVSLYQQIGTFATPIILVNAPDSAMATLRPTLLPNLVDYAKRSLGFRQKRIALFEIGKTYAKEKKQYKETNTLGLIMHGELSSTSWNKLPRELSLYDLSGVLEGLFKNLGLVSVHIVTGGTHPSMDTQIQGSITIDTTVVGSFGRLHPMIASTLSIPHETFVAELSLSALSAVATRQPQPYVIAPSYPPMIEDITFTAKDDTRVGDIISAIRALDAKIKDVELVDVYEHNRSLRVTYSDPTTSLSALDVRPIHNHIMQTLREKFDITIT
jgi:phenylalanyl-tRNA synthetase beta chain